MHSASKYQAASLSHLAEVTVLMASGQLGGTNRMSTVEARQHSNDSGIRDEGKGSTHEVAGTTENGFWKAWYLNLPLTDELHSIYSVPQSPPGCSSPASISELVSVRLSLVLKTNCPSGTSDLCLGAFCHSLSFYKL